MLKDFLKKLTVFNQTLKNEQEKKNRKGFPKIDCDFLKENFIKKRNE